MLWGSHIKIWNLANHLKKKPIKMLNLLMINWKLRVWCSLFHFFHVICKISIFNMWTAKHLAQGSCTEFTLQKIEHYICFPHKKTTLKWYFSKFQKVSLLPWLPNLTKNNKNTRLIWIFIVILWIYRIVASSNAC